MPLEDRWLHRYSQDIRIHFVAVWDTVGALGLPIPQNISDLSESSFNFYDTNLRLNYDYAFHALAIDEQRKHFSPTLWTKFLTNESQRRLDHVEQRWFVGTHGNVGGGYASDSLPQLPLKWIMGKAEMAGLTFRNQIEVDPDASTARIPDSRAEFLDGAYALISRPHYRPIGTEPYSSDRGVVRTINETIDKSVFARWNQDQSYRPPNLTTWAHLRNVDIATLAKSIHAEDPTIVIDDQLVEMPTAAR